MKEMRLLKLALEYFKGARNFTLDAAGKEVRIYGTNEAGKTTLYDAFLWLMFHKDSENKADFGIKTLENGKELHNLEHSVEGSFLIDGRRRTFRKAFKEKWTQKRGSASTDFSGHTTDYFVDGVPCSKTEYDAEVKGIVSEDVFKLLTNPFHFHEHKHWSDRLKVLLTVCGDVSDADVISGTTNLKGLLDILDGRSIEQHRKMVAARQTKINDELKDIPIRISEANRSLPELPEEGERFYEINISEIRDIIAQKQAEIVRIQSGSEVTVKQNRIREIEGELQHLKNQLQGNTLEVIASKRRGISSIQREIENIRFDIDSKKNQLSRNEKTIQRLESEADDLRLRFGKRNTEQFQAHDHNEACTACGQALPAERIAEAHTKAEEAFNLSKSRDLETIRNQGKTAKSESERFQEENKTIEAEIDQLFARAEQERKNLEASNTSLAESEATVTDVESHPEYIARSNEIAAVRSEISLLHDSSTQSVDAVKAEISKHQDSVSELERERAKFGLAATIQKRIAELEDQEKELAAEYERLAHELFLTEEFTRAKTAMMEDRINSKFKLARFKLFKDQINGGLEDTCVATFKGVPFDAGLNNAARINVGLDIINTLSEHYGVSVPIFIDNAESVVDMIDTVGQKVSLIVSRKDKQLRVEMVGDSMKEAV
jgi:DNA repair exonuclease SbcCD ATPase subunit